MFVQRIYKKSNNKQYCSIVLMENYRHEGKVKHRIISNLSKWPEDLVIKLEKLLKGQAIFSISDFEFSQGKSIGGLIVAKEIFKRLGLYGLLSKSKEGRLAMIQICGRIFTQKSRLYLATQWSKTHALGEVFNIEAFNEDDLYKNLDWLSNKQAEIEDMLFHQRHKSGTIKEIFLYDVTSSYLEGQQNELAEYGYNRDNKKGKKQIVIGLLCDNEGYPISVEVFKGNTNDTRTVASQLKKLKERFGVEKVVFVGDKGMLKCQQIDEILSDEFKWHYITSITKSQIESLLEKRVIQLGMFDDQLAEVEYEGVRYILRRNPLRSEEAEKSRQSKISAIKKKVSENNNYLISHPKAKITTALKKIENYITNLKMQQIVSCYAKERELYIEIIQENLENAGMLDGCYVIKTDIPKKEMGKEFIHDRYKDLALVEQAFRTMKTSIEEIRPLYLRKENRTRGHVFVCMLAYMAIKYMCDQLKDTGFTRNFILETLDGIQYIEYKFDKEKMKVMPKKLLECNNLILEKLNIKIPTYV